MVTPAPPPLPRWYWNASFVSGPRLRNQLRAGAGEGQMAAQRRQPSIVRRLFNLDNDDDDDDDDNDNVLALAIFPEWNKSRPVVTETQTKHEKKTRLDEK